MACKGKDGSESINRVIVRERSQQPQCGLAEDEVLFCWVLAQKLLLPVQINIAVKFSLFLLNTGCWS